MCFLIYKQNKISNSKETEHFKPLTKFHNSLQTHTLLNNFQFPSTQTVMAPHQFVPTDKRAKNTNHTECKLNRWLSEFQREAEDASTDWKFS
jgi:hypothetical protein